MSLEAGRTLGPYEVVEPIGKGGMGEVYRARDTKLDRHVAIKVLPEEFASDEERLARFEREAKLLASLNHPNIASIHGFEESDGAKALVLELVEGPTLAERIEQGPIPVDEAIAIAKQIAEALEAGHEAGVIHRDLKPANVKVKEDGTVKVLDYGLAKALEGEETSGTDSKLSQSPTLTRHGTQVGVILGTAAYMSPEQARGKRVDRRADIWAFGAVLFEMLTGTKPFPGDDTSQILARVIDGEPDWNALPATVSSSSVTYLRRCLRKDPRQRVQAIGDVRLALEGAFEPAATPPGAVFQPVGWRPSLGTAAAAAMLLSVISGIAVWNLQRAAPRRQLPLGRFELVLPTNAPIAPGLFNPLAVSPDGTRIIYVANAASATQLYVRSLADLTAAPLPGTGGILVDPGGGPFFSADGASVAFFTDQKLKAVSLQGGSVRTICDALNNRGGSWGNDETIVFAAVAERGVALYRVAAAGGEPEILAAPDPQKDEREYRSPHILPDGNSVIFTIISDEPNSVSRIAVLSLRTGETRSLREGARGARYVTTGHLLYEADEGTVMAVAFDADRLEFVGDAVPVLEVVNQSAGGMMDIAVSDTGVLAYVPETTAPKRTLVWIDREGNEELLAARPGNYLYPRLSPDGTKAAIEEFEGTGDIWVWDFSRETLTRLTVDPASDEYPVWTPDGQRVIFSSDRDGGSKNPYWVAADGSGGVERLAEHPRHIYPQTISPDGARVVLRENVQASEQNLLMLTLDDGRVETLVSSERFAERNAEVSPDGRWMAYESDESGQFEIYVRPFPNVDEARVQVSSDGGAEAVWARSGDAMFYRNRDGALMRVPVQLGDTFQPGKEVVVPSSTFTGIGVFHGRTYDVSPDGQRFLMIKEDEQPEKAGARIIVVLDWFEELKRLVPTED